jgi:hypothetical protein
VIQEPDPRNLHRGLAAVTQGKPWLYIDTIWVVDLEAGNGHAISPKDSRVFNGLRFSRRYTRRHL